MKDVTLEVPERSILAIIGPSGSGKSTFLRCFNRMNDLIPGARVTGKVQLDGEDLMHPDVSVVELRRRVGMVFQRPNPFPMSIYDNVAYGPRRRGNTNRADLDELVERSLTRAALWDEVKDELEEVGPGAVGWPAAAAVHRAGPGDRAGGDPDGRAGVRPGSPLHAPDRGADARAPGGLHDRSS